MAKQENFNQGYFIENKETEKESFFSLRTIIDFLIARWYWFLFSIVTCVILMRLFIATIVPVYQRQAMIMIKSDDKARVSEDMSAFLGLNEWIATNKLENELYILKSTPLLEEVVKKLHLDVVYETPLWLRKETLFHNTPLLVIFLDPFKDVTTFRVSPVDAKHCMITNVVIDNEKSAWKKKIPYYSPVNTPFGNIIIQPNSEAHAEKEGEDNYADEDIYVTRLSINDVVLYYKSCLSTELLNETSLITISCKDVNLVRIDSVLNALIEVYNKFTLDDKNKVAQNTEKFIEGRIAILARELGVVDSKLAEIKSQNRILDLKTGGIQYLSDGSKAKDATLSLETQVAVATYLRDYLEDSSNENELIPELKGTEELATTTQISSYNEMMLHRDRLSKNSSQDAPVVAEIDAGLKLLRVSIKNSLDASVKALKIRLDRARLFENTIDELITSVPVQEMNLLDATRQQQIKASLYTFLLNKREENVIKLAIMGSHVRLIEPPYGDDKWYHPSAVS